MGESPRPITASILAAGLGRRLGHRPKAALEIGGVSLLERTITALRTSGIRQVSVVIGAYPEVLLPLAARAGAWALTHGHANSKLIDSQRLALAHHLEWQPDHDLLLVLGDLPWLAAADMAPLLEAWQQRPTFIHAQMPLVDGVRGHPLILSALAARQVMDMPSGMGIRDWLGRHPHLVKPVVSTRRAYITDLDTPEDLSALESGLAPEAVAWPVPWDRRDLQPATSPHSYNTSDV